MSKLYKKVHWYFVTCAYFNEARGDAFSLNPEEVTCLRCRPVTAKAAQPEGHSGSSLTCSHPFCVAERGER